MVEANEDCRMRMLIPLTTSGGSKRGQEAVPHPLSSFCCVWGHCLALPTRLELRTHPRLGHPILRIPGTGLKNFPFSRGPYREPWNPKARMAARGSLFRRSTPFFDSQAEDLGVLGVLASILLGCFGFRALGFRVASCCKRAGSYRSKRLEASGCKTA